MSQKQTEMEYAPFRGQVQTDFGGGVPKSLRNVENRRTKMKTELSRFAHAGQRACAHALFLSAVLLAGSSHFAHAATIKVPSEKPTIQDAINAAATGDTILVADGTYSGIKFRNITFGGKRLTVKSSGGAAKCILDCRDMARAFVFSSTDPDNSIIEGFTIKNGFGDGADGGAIYVGTSNNGNPARISIIRCIFTNNKSTFKGGFLGGGSGGNGGAVSGGRIYDSVFTGNSATDTGGAMVDGEAIRCTFTNNTTPGTGGALGCPRLGNGALAIHCTFRANSAANGGAMYNGDAIDCTFANNFTTGSGGNGLGGAFYIVERGALGGGGGMAQRCIFKGNTAQKGGAIYGGYVLDSLFFGNRAVDGGAFVGIGTLGGGGGGGGTPRVSHAVNCIFSGNVATGNGGAILNATLVNCTVVGNTAETGSGGGVCNKTGDNAITNSIVWGNSSIIRNPNVKSDGGTLVVNYSNIQGGYTGGTGNINADPQFADASLGDFHLKSGSPCIDVGATLVQYLPEKDCSGGARILGAEPDLGAHETGNYNLAAPITAVQDFNADGMPDFLTETEGKPTYGYTAHTTDSAEITGFGMTPQAPTGGWKVVTAGQFYGETASPSLVLVHPTDRRVHYWTLDGTTRTGGVFTYYTNQTNQHMTLPAGFYILGAADFDEDRFEDIVWFDPFLRRLGVWSMKGASFYSGAYLSHTLFQGWNIVAMGRLDYFSFPEMLLLGPNREVHVWYMTYGWQWYSGSYVRNPADNSIVTLPEGSSIVGMGDFDRDGLDEIVVQNRAENKIEMWKLDYYLNLLGKYPIKLR
jgi:hypothetical protein